MISSIRTASLEEQTVRFCSHIQKHVVGFFVLAKTKSYNLNFSLSFFQLFIVACSLSLAIFNTSFTLLVHFIL